MPGQRGAVRRAIRVACSGAAAAGDEGRGEWTVGFYYYLTCYCFSFNRWRQISEKPFQVTVVMSKKYGYYF